VTVVGVVVFPGTNCELDVAEAYGGLGADTRLLWHGEPSVGDADVVVLPGGFAHGDYLRTGAIARFSPVMAAVEEHARGGGPVIGICNGFQILTEAGLLPGALQKNAGLKFLCKTVPVRVVSNRSVLTSECAPGSVRQLPINHFEGNYTCDASTLAMLADEDRIVLAYEDCPNGSTGSIAGVCNAAGNIVGLMPHPERACHRLLGSTDGVDLLRSTLAVATAAAR
jgi:phosphoribosylformylglycinamidine synthase